MAAWMDVSHTDWEVWSLSWEDSSGVSGWDTFWFWYNVRLDFGFIGNFNLGSRYVLECTRLRDVDRLDLDLNFFVDFGRDVGDTGGKPLGWDFSCSL